MIELKIKPGESIHDFIQRCIQELHKRTNIPDHIIHEFHNIKTEGDYIRFVKLTKCEFKSYNAAELIGTKPEYKLDTTTFEIHPMDKTNQYYMDIKGKKKRINTKLKRLMR